MPELGQGTNGQFHSAQPFDELPDESLNNDGPSHQPHDLDSPLNDPLHEP